MDEFEHSLQLGQCYLFRTVTHYSVGRVVRVTASDIALSDAWWVADTGRFGACLAMGTFSEVEYCGDMFVARGALVDFFPWRHALPTMPGAQ